MAKFQWRQPPDLAADSRKDWEIVEAVLGLTDADDGQRRKGREWIGRHFWLHDINHRTDVRYRSSNMKRALEELRKHTLPLLAYLSPGKEVPKNRLKYLDVAAMNDFVIGAVDRKKRKAILNGLSELLTAIEETTRSLAEDRGGELPDLHFCMLINGLGNVYRFYTHRQPGVSNTHDKGQPRGPFFVFIKSCVTLFAPSALPLDRALAKAIQTCPEIYAHRQSSAWTRPSSNLSGRVHFDVDPSPPHTQISSPVICPDAGG